MKNQDIKMIPDSLIINYTPISNFSLGTVGELTYKKGEIVFKRNAYGKMLAQIGSKKMVVALNVDTKNFTISRLQKSLS